MRCEQTQLETVMFSNFDALMQSSYRVLIKEGYTSDQAMDFLDQEFEVLKETLLYQTFLDHEFKGFWVDFSELGNNRLILRSLTGFTLYMNRTYIATLIAWIARDKAVRRASWKNMVVLDNRAYEVVGSDEEVGLRNTPAPLSLDLIKAYKTYLE